MTSRSPRWRIAQLIARSTYMMGTKYDHCPVRKGPSGAYAISYAHIFVLRGQCANGGTKRNHQIPLARVCKTQMRSIVDTIHIKGGFDKPIWLRVPRCEGAVLRRAEFVGKHVVHLSVRGR